MKKAIQAAVAAAECVANLAALIDNELGSAEVLKGAVKALGATLTGGVAATETPVETPVEPAATVEQDEATDTVAVFDTAGEVALRDALAELARTGKPQALTFEGEPLMVAYDLTTAAIKAPLSAYANAISGSFSYNCAPCSILVSQGSIVHDQACHAWQGFPEAVFMRTKTGEIGVKVALTTADIPDAFWAVGGFGLLKHYDPEGQGFTGAYADVLRKTAHTWLGVKRGGNGIQRLYLGYVASMTAQELNAYVARLGMDAAIMLDGGHVAAINCSAAQKNTAQTQYYIVQAI